jgi:hypothetical protein
MHFISRLLPILIVVSGHKFNEWIVCLLLVASPLVAQKPTMTESFIRALANDFGTVGRAPHNSFPNYLAANSFGWLSFSPIPSHHCHGQTQPSL